MTPRFDRFPDPHDVICHCSGTTLKQILDLIDDGFDTLEKLSRMTGASAGCGACETELQDLLDEHL